LLEFGFDPDNSATNLAKHGVDFTAAQAIWRDAHRVEVPARTMDEPRWMVIGQAGGQLSSSVITYRNEQVPIISVRRSQKGEVAMYEGLRSSTSGSTAARTCLPHWTRHGPGAPEKNTDESTSTSQRR
jgi:uncharacterized protein